MNRRYLLKIICSVVSSSVFLNYATLSFSIESDEVCIERSRPKPESCVYQCKCECCTGVSISAPGETREGYQNYNCKIYTWRSDDYWVDGLKDISSQPTTLPFQPFKSDHPLYYNQVFCNQGGDLACCVKECIEYYPDGAKPKYDEWGNFIGWDNPCKTYRYLEKWDGVDYDYSDTWDENRLPNLDYAARCTDYDVLPTDPAVTNIKCQHMNGRFQRVCNRWYTDPLVAGALGPCTFKVTVPPQAACPGVTSATCTTACANAIAAGTIACP